MNLANVTLRAAAALAIAFMVTHAAADDDWEYAQNDYSTVTSELSAQNNTDANSQQTVAIKHAFQLNHRYDPMDFSADIRKGLERSPQTVIGDLIVDGGLGVKLINW